MPKFNPSTFAAGIGPTSINIPLIRFTLGVKDTVQQITKKMTKAVRDSLNEGMSRAIPVIRGRVSRFIAKSIRSSQTYQELVKQGNLYHEIGALKAEAGLEEMIGRINKTTEFKFSRFRTLGTGNVVGKFTVKMIDNQVDQYIGSSGSFDTQSILSATDPHLRSLGSAIDDNTEDFILDEHTIAWLEWLLKSGDKIVVRDYTFVLGNSKSSRTGLGIMRESKSGRGWRIPPEHSGTATNNFVTRAIDGNLKRIGDIITKEFLKGLNI